MRLLALIARLVCFLIGHREPVYLVCPDKATGCVPYCMRCGERGDLP